MAQLSKTNVVVAIDTNDASVHFYYAEDGDKNRIVHDVREYRTGDFNEEFFRVFESFLRDFAGKYPSAYASQATIVLPDNVVFCDTIHIPIVKKGTQNLSLLNSINTFYKNRKDLSMNVSRAFNAKQYYTSVVIGTRNDLLASIKSACQAARLDVSNIIFASLAVSNAAQIFNSKCKTATYLMLDVRSNFTRLVYCFKGKAIAYSSLPFGYAILDAQKVAAEDMLFDHSIAELAVINSREKAKAKELTMLGEDNPDMIAPMEEGEEGEDEASFTMSYMQSSRTNAKVIKTLPRKAARKLPKFMLRPVPQNEQETAYENFRIIEKWALTFLNNNSNLTALGQPEMIYVNMPERFNFLYDMVNAEAKENGIRFHALGAEKNKGDITENMELFGAMYAKTFNQNNSFELERRDTAPKPAFARFSLDKSSAKSSAKADEA